MEIKRYQIKRVRFKQGPLLYNELLEVLKVLKGRFKNFTANAQAFGELLDELETEGTLPKLMRIVLKPDNHRPWWWLTNRFWARFHKVDLRDPIASMNTVEIARVATDFFLVNLNWIDVWMNSPLDSTLSLHKRTPKEILFGLTSIFTPPLTADSPTPSSSESSTVSS